MKKKLLILFAIYSFGNLSCKKYLDAKSNSTLSTPTTITALQSLLDNGQYMNTSPSFGEASADDYYMPQSSFDEMSPLVQQAYLWNATGRSDYTFSGGTDWSYMYLIVYNANLCLEQIEKIQRTTQNANAWDNIKGSALFFRGRSFLQLAWIFAKAYNSSASLKDPGIPLRLASDFNVSSSRASVAQTYDQVIEDLKASVPLLPNLPQQLLRPSKAAAYGYLARAYLSMGDYDSAYKYADLTLQLKNDLLDFNDNSIIDTTANFPIPQFNVEVIHHQNDNVYVFLSIYQYYARVDSTLVNSYQENDLRKKLYFFDNGDGWEFKGSYSGNDSWFTGVATDEMYLIRAESSARLGNISATINDLNALLTKRWRTGTFVPLSFGTISDAINTCLIERRKELIFRDLRWIDIKRLNLQNANISITRLINNQQYILPPNDNRFALPLPTDIIGLSGMSQNP